MAESGPRGGVGRAALATAACALALACATPAARGGPEDRVRLDVPAAVGWEPEGPFVLPLEIHNATGVALSLARPTAEAVQVELFRADDGRRACRTPSPTHRQYESREVARVRGASGLPLRVDVWPYCRNLTPGLYRYEVVYVANPAEAGGGLAFAGTLGPRSGRVAIGAGLSRGGEPLAAALAAQPGEPAGPPVRPPGEPAGTGASAAGEVARQCVDRALALRGLNAYGDPQGTRYPDGPPADEGGRALYVAGRNAEIREACGFGGR